MTPAELWTLELDKAAAGAKPDGRPAGLFGWLAVYMAILLGAPAWLATAVLFGRDPSDPPPSEAWAALHGEVENRTRPLLDILAAEAPDTPILLLGRPHRSLAAVAALFAGRGLPKARLFRPWSLGDAVATIGEFLATISAGYRVAAARPGPLPPPAEMVAIVFRLGLGLASRRWAARQGGRAGVVIFGHTGLADTSLLELGLQAAGVRTVHYVHGVSKGWDFTGVSSRAVFQCDSDARWHLALGGYGEATAFRAKPTEPRPEGQGWLLLSNRAHPMDPDYQASGLKAELALLESLAEAADLAGQPRAEVTWRPHPIFAALPAAQKSALLAACERLGLRFWDPSGAGLEAARDYQFVVVSPSTAAIDMLRLGKLPIIFGRAGNPSSAIAQFPCQAEDARSLAALASELADTARWRVRYGEAWEAVGPGRKPGWTDLIRP
jgi:hypothetical protein